MDMDQSDMYLSLETVQDSQHNVNMHLMIWIFFVQQAYRKKVIDELTQNSTSLKRELQMSDPFRKKTCESKCEKEMEDNAD